MKVETKNMKILHINSYYSCSKFYKNLYDIQRQNGLNISVFVPVALHVKDEKDFGEYTTISVNHSKLDRYIFKLKHSKILKDAIEKYEIQNYSIIHAHSLFSNGYIAMKLKEKFGVPYIVAVRNTDVNVFFKRMLHMRNLGIQIINNAEKIIFLSKTYRDEVLNKYIPEKYKEKIKNKSLILPNGIDEFWFNNMGVAKAKPDEFSKLKILQIGDINKNKNLKTTINSVKILINEGYNVELDVVGKIKDAKIFKEIEKYSFINYLGYKTKEELIKIYKENHIFVLPSIYETFGLVYAEAMSQGLPIIYTKGQGFDGQFVEGEVGYSVKYDDYKDIAYKVKKIIYDYKQISNNCISNIENYRWEKIGDKYLSVYDNIK